MPSPSIPRSSSYPQLSHTRLPPSSRSACSAPVPKARITSKLWWEQKIQRLLGRRSTDSDLTQESLEHHNRIQETLDHELQKRVQEISLHEAFNAERDLSKYSPYYIRGLTYPKPVVPPSPGPGDSQHSSAPTWTSISTFLFKMSGWTSCGAGSKKDKLYGKKLKAQAIYTAVKHRPAVPVTPNELSANSETSNMVVNEEISSTVDNIEKPLRERVLEAAAAARPTNKEKVTNESEYILADKYQPQCLEDFICNRDKAIQLKVLVCIAPFSID